MLLAQAAFDCYLNRYWRPKKCAGLHELLFAIKETQMKDTERQTRRNDIGRMSMGDRRAGGG